MFSFNTTDMEPGREVVSFTEILLDSGIVEEVACLRVHIDAPLLNVLVITANFIVSVEGSNLFLAE